MMIRLTIALATAAALAAAGGWIDTIIQPDTVYMTACDGGVVDATDGGDNDVWVTCAWSPDEHVVCALPGAVGWGFSGGGQVVVTCGAGPK